MKQNESFIFEGYRESKGSFNKRRRFYFIVQGLGFTVGFTVMTLMIWYIYIGNYNNLVLTILTDAFALATVMIFPLYMTKDAFLSKRFTVTDDYIIPPVVPLWLRKEYDGKIPIEEIDAVGLYPTDFAEQGSIDKIEGGVFFLKDGKEIHIKESVISDEVIEKMLELREQYPPY